MAIILWQLEKCPYCKKVGKKLAELEIKPIIIAIDDDYQKKSEALKKIGGMTQVPFIIDTDTGAKMYESDDIINYLEEIYSK